MTNEPEQSGRELPWAFVLDPSANARALNDVQRRGLHAARVLADRVVAGLDRFDDATSGPGTSAKGATTSGASPGGGDPVMDLVQAWSRLLTRSLEVFGSGTGVDSAPRGEDPGPAAAATRADVGGGDTKWTLDADEKGQLRQDARLDLVNSSSRPVGPLRFHLGDLRSPDGASIPSSMLQFAPSSISELRPGATATVRLLLSLPEPVEAGTYRGVILLDGAEDTSVALCLRVTSSPA
ncbi:MAG: hypothetical protein JO368_10380 [Acidimicrobiales bacterium]|nr:hypothetical protein [Acidimicrobiales bacterium]